MLINILIKIVVHIFYALNGSWSAYILKGVSHLLQILAKIDVIEWPSTNSDIVKLYCKISKIVFIGFVVKKIQESNK